jgi:hypothetical protein
MECEVADDDFPAGIPFAPAGDEAVGEAARLAALGKDAGADLQERFHVRSLSVLSCMAALWH